MRRPSKKSVAAFIVLFLFLYIFRVYYFGDFDRSDGRNPLQAAKGQPMLAVTMPGGSGASPVTEQRETETGDSVYTEQGPLYIWTGPASAVILLFLFHGSLYERIRIIHMKDGKKRFDKAILFVNG